MTPLSPYIFDVYALSLPKGLGFGANKPVSVWASSDHLTVGALLQNHHSRKYGVLIMRRREDEVWAVLRKESESLSNDEALAIIRQACDEAACLVPRDMKQVAFSNC